MRQSCDVRLPALTRRAGHSRPGKRKRTAMPCTGCMRSTNACATRPIPRTRKALSDERPTGSRVRRPRRRRVLRVRRHGRSGYHRIWGRRGLPQNGPLRLPMPQRRRLMSFYVGADGFIYRGCDGTCDTCPTWCWTGKPAQNLYDIEGDEDWEDTDDVPTGWDGDDGEKAGGNGERSG